MKCKSLVIGSIAGLALKAAVLSFQVLADKKQKIWCKKNRKKSFDSNRDLLIRRVSDLAKE